MAARSQSAKAESDSFVPSPSSPSSPNKINQEKTNEDFQSLLNCFPHLSVHQVLGMMLFSSVVTLHHAQNYILTKSFQFGGTFLTSWNNLLFATVFLLSQIYPVYLQAKGSLEEAVSLVLEQAQHQETAKPTAPAQSTFCVTLDAQFAAQVEDAFGNARKGENFPGLLQANIPASLAREELMHIALECIE